MNYNNADCYHNSLDEKNENALLNSVSAFIIIERDKNYIWFEQRDSKTLW